MTNDEKRLYISDLVKANAVQFQNAFIQKEKVIFKNPKYLFKYRKFDRYSYDMLEKNYIYFCPADKLDDPFECRGFIPKGIVKENYRKQYIKRVLKFLLSKMNISDKEKLQEIEKAFIDAIGPDEIDRERLFNNLPIEAFTDVDMRQATNFLSNIQLKVDQITGDKNIENYINSSNSGEEKMGVFAMSEENKSRIMWSLYADNYKGYCIEYDFSDSPFRNILFPVVYKKNFKNDILHNTVMLNENVLIEQFSLGTIKGDFSWGLIQYLNKDISWKAQKEWRLLYNPNFYADAPKIKSIYLGCNATKTNIKKMINYSRKMNFDLFMMKIDQKRNRLFFEKV